MLSKTEYQHRENGLNIGKHALLLFISIMISFVVHFCFAFFYDSIIDESAFHVTKTKDKPQDPEDDAPLRFTELNRIIGIAHETPAISPDIQQAVETTNVHDLADDAIAQILQTPQMPDRPFVPEAVDEAALSIPGDENVDLPPPPVASIRQEVISLPETEHIEAAWAIDNSTLREEIGTDVAFTMPLFNGSYVDASIGSGVALAPVGNGTEDGGVFQPEGSVLQKLEEEGTRSVVEKELQTIANDTTPPPELPLAESDEAIEKALESLQLPTVAGEADAPRKFVAIDKSLSVALKLYSSPADTTHDYYQIDIVRRPESPLPIMPKDVVFIQDISGSIGSKRMEACKVALKSALYHTLRHGDRFTIFAFRDLTLTPAATWMTFDSSSREKTDTFIDSLRARGDTDIFSLLSQDLPTLKRHQTRPLIAIIITDGEATAGVTETTKIIGEFTRLNQGNIAVYTFNAKRFDPYFLDMLCYSNRGENISSSGDPEKVSEELQPIFDKIRNPVMKDVTLTFDTQSASEIHPQKLTHLFADRYLTVYGRVPKSAHEISCQLKGQAADRNYDAVFQFNLKDATKTDENLRYQWAKRAMFDMLAEYAANPSSTLLKQIEEFSQLYHVTNPYRSVPTKAPVKN
jgi:hypothetical protein